MNRKGFATSTILFSLLSVFLIVISILLVTLSNATNTKKTLNEAAVNSIEYGSSSITELENEISELTNQVTELKQQVITLNNFKSKLGDNLSNLKLIYIKPTMADNITYRDGGYAKIGNLVIVNIHFAIKDVDKISNSVNSPTLIMSDLPKPIYTFSALSARTPEGFTDYPEDPGMQFIHASVYRNDSWKDGRIGISGNKGVFPLQSNWSINVMGVYLAEE